MTSEEAPAAEVPEKKSSGRALPEPAPSERARPTASSPASAPADAATALPDPAHQGATAPPSDARTGAMAERMLDTPLRVVVLLVGVTLLFDRAFLPNFRGTFVGLDRLTELLRLGGSFLSQFVAIASTMTALALLFSVLSRRVSGAAKAAAVVGVSAAMVQATLAMGADRPDWRVMTLAGLAISTFVATAARVAIPLRAIRISGIVAALTAFAALAHVAGAVHADLRGPRAYESLANPPQVLATAAVVLELVSVVLAGVWLFGVQGGKVRLAVAAVVTAGATWLALPSDDASPLRLLVRHGARNLVSSPPSLVPWAIVVAAALGGVCVAFAVLTVRGVLPMAPISLGGLLLGRCMVDVPLLGLVLALAAGALALLSTEPRVMWASLPPVRSRPAPADAEAPTSRPG